MPQQPVFMLNAVLHKDLPSSTRVFSIYDIEYFLWVKVAPNIAKHFSLYQIDEVGLNPKMNLDLSEMCHHDTMNIWFKLTSSYLNRNAGQHVYRMHFVHKKDGHTISLFFSYVVQTEYLERPYDYMKKEEEVLYQHEPDIF